jgi:hypothetical protein
MSTFSVWVVIATHANYGNAILCSRMASNKEIAIKECLYAVKSDVQKDDKRFIDNEINTIIANLMEHNEYEQDEDGLRLVAELQTFKMTISEIIPKFS